MHRPWLLICLVAIALPVACSSGSKSDKAAADAIEREQRVKDLETAVSALQKKAGNNFPVDAAAVRAAVETQVATGAPAAVPTRTATPVPPPVASTPTPAPPTPAPVSAVSPERAGTQAAASPAT